MEKVQVTGVRLNRPSMDSCLGSLRNVFLLFILVCQNIEIKINEWTKNWEHRANSSECRSHVRLLFCFVLFLIKLQIAPKIDENEIHCTPSTALNPIRHFNYITSSAQIILLVNYK